MTRYKTSPTGHKGVYMTPQGQYWIRVKARDPRTGKNKERSKLMDQGASLGQAIDLRDQMQAWLGRGQELQEPEDQDAHQVQAITPRRVTFRDYCDTWLEGKARALRPPIYRLYAANFAHHILPILGDIYLDALTRRDVLAWVGRAEVKLTRKGQPYSRDSRRQWWRNLSGLLQDAYADGLTDSDLTFRVKPPKGPSKPRVRETRTLTPQQTQALFEAVEATNPDRLLEVMVLAYTGLRSGELWALRWQDLDLPCAIAHIRHSVQDSRTLCLVKTEHPREVPLHQTLVPMLQAWRTRQLEQQHPGLALGLVFPSEEGTLRTRGSLRRALVRASQVAELESHVTPQVLRRSFNTQMIAAGVDRVVLRSMMGHCSEEMTQRYAGVGHQLKADALAALGSTPTPVVAQKEVGWVQQVGTSPSVHPQKASGQAKRSTKMEG